MKTFNFRRLRIQSAMTVALLVACVLATGNCSPVTAQVAIGGDGTVTPGALLDLSQATDAGGLLLPQIESADTLNEELKKPGMLVYNKTDGKVYTYNGSFWTAGGSGGGDNPGPAPESIIISASPSGPVLVDATTTLTATVLPVNAGWTTVNWGGNVPTIALVDAVDGSPNTATVTGIHNGNTTVTASVAGVSSDPFTIQIGIPPTGISITGATSPTSIGVGGKTLQLGCSITPGNQTYPVSWWSSDETIATVDNTGQVTSSATTIGSVEITAKVGNITSDPFIVNVGHCTGTITGVSGFEYPIGSYAYVENDLRNLCWTLTNLKEAGAANTSFPGQDENRGYYYQWSVAATPSNNDICKRGLGLDWRMPTDDDWTLLRDEIDNLTPEDVAYWNAAPASMAGMVPNRSSGWPQWDTSAYWFSSSADRRLFIYWKNSSEAYQWTFIQQQSSNDSDNYRFTVRCVRSL
ncbi:MAG: Ig-like domain-containing protein [Candidatus Symbiothrix sp.]|nr:Ig-like domain-containing protein [Candidatus Symbiothrix sp.]